MYHLAHWRGVLRRQLSLKDNALTMLEASHIADICRDVGYNWRERIWTPCLTLLTFLQQVLSTTKTCRSAVAATLNQLESSGYEGRLPSAADSPYCQARRRVPLAVMTRLHRQTSDVLTEAARLGRRWCGRVVRIIDGSSVTMPDTPSLQAEFPQPKGQEPGCGFPTARLVGLFDWFTGALIELVMDSLKVGEIHLARRVWEHLQPNDVLLGDRLFGSYADFALLQQRGVDCVTRMHQARRADYRRGKRLGVYDCVVRWERPAASNRPRGMTIEELLNLPAYLDVRLIRFFAKQNGFRSRTIDVATTLLDAVEYPAGEISQLYQDRWLVEVNLRSLKSHLGMEVLRTKSPDAVKKELALYAIAYNLIRTLMYEAATLHEVTLHQLSFTGTMHRIDALLPIVWTQSDRSEEVIESLLHSIATDLLPIRPGRREPRRVKRRPKAYSRLTRPRSEYKALKRDMDRDAR